MRTPIRFISLAAVATTAVAAAAPADPVNVIKSIDLSGPFATRSPWRFVASQGPDENIEISDPRDMLPGRITLCLSKDGGRTCRPDLRKPLAADAGIDLYSDPHYLNTAAVVRPQGSGRALLILQFASLPSVDGNELVMTRAFAYDRATDDFIEAYRKATGRNNNQEVRYIDTGPLRGAIIAAEPTQDAPFGYWITVNRIGPSFRYRPVLRFRSATRYGDGNPLHVIDSEMPNIQRRLGLWRAGQKLPLPAGGCARPRLVKSALWCD